MQFFFNIIMTEKWKIKECKIRLCLRAPLPRSGVQLTSEATAIAPSYISFYYARKNKTEKLRQQKTGTAKKKKKKGGGMNN